MQERSEAERRANMAMPQCCYLAKGANRPSHTTNMLTSSNNNLKKIAAILFEWPNFLGRNFRLGVISLGVMSLGVMSLGVMSYNPRNGINVRG